MNLGDISLDSFQLPQNDIQTTDTIATQVISGIVPKSDSTGMGIGVTCTGQPARYVLMLRHALHCWSRVPTMVCMIERIIIYCSKRANHELVSCMKDSHGQKHVAGLFGVHEVHNCAARTETFDSSCNAHILSGFSPCTHYFPSIESQIRLPRFTSCAQPLFLLVWKANTLASAVRLWFNFLIFGFFLVFLKLGVHLKRARLSQMRSLRSRG